MIETRILIKMLWQAWCNKMTSSAVNTLRQGQLKVAPYTHNEQANGGCQRAVFNVTLRDKKHRISDTEDVKQRGTKCLTIRRHLVSRRERHLGGLGVSILLHKYTPHMSARREGAWVDGRGRPHRGRTRHEMGREFVPVNLRKKIKIHRPHATRYQRWHLWRTCSSCRGLCSQ